jgi:hypothetical protein
MDPEPPDDRRTRPTIRRPGGLRFEDDPFLVSMGCPGAVAIGAELYRRRLNREWSQDYLAKLSGLSTDTLDRMERGRGNFEWHSFVRAFAWFGPDAIADTLIAAATAYKRAKRSTSSTTA